MTTPPCVFSSQNLVEGGGEDEHERVEEGEEQGRDHDGYLHTQKLER